MANTNFFIPFRFAQKHIGYLDTYYYLPFGAGPRVCIGMRLALIEMKIAAVHLLQKFKFKTCSRTQVKLEFTSHKGCIYVKFSEDCHNLLFQIPPNLKLGFNMREKDGTWLQAECRSHNT